MKSIKEGRRVLGWTKHIHIPKRQLSTILDTQNAAMPQAKSFSIDDFSYQKPQIRLSPFKKQHRVLEQLPKDTYPNPLFAMSKDEIHRLKKLEYENLITIPYKSLNETDEFCEQVVELIKEIILSDCKRASVFIRSIKDPHLQDRVWGSLARSFKNDKIRSSLLTYIISDSYYNFQPEFLSTIEYMMQECDSESAPAVILKYIDTLASVVKVNEAPILLKASTYDTIFKMVPRANYAQFFSYLVNLNMKPYSMGKLIELKSELAKGTNLEKYVLKTGLKDAKWHHTQLMVFDDDHRKKMVNFYTLKEFKNNALYAIEHELVTEANLFLDLMVEKFEIHCKSSHKTKNDIKKYLQSIIHVLLNHVMVFKGSENCTNILKYFVKNHVEITFDTLLSVIRNLRKQGYHAEVLTMMKNIKLNNKTREEKNQLVAEIISLISQRYPNEPKILIGYMASFFTNCIDYLNKLGLLSVVYERNKYTDYNEWLTTVQVANVDANLKNLDVTHDSLAKLYESILQTKKLSLFKSGHAIQSLYEKYIQMLPQIKEMKKFDDSVVTLFVRHLLLIQPNNLNMQLNDNYHHYEICRKILEDFHSKLPEMTNNIDCKHNVALYDLMIIASLMIHNDYAFAAKVTRASKSLGVPFTFNQIYPFILYHYQRNEYEQAEIWYKELVSQGVKATSQPAKKIFKIARKLNWDVSGFVYRKYGMLKNRQENLEKERVFKDDINYAFFNKLDYGDSTEDMVTNELFGTQAVEQKSEIDLGEKLSDILYEIENQKVGKEE